MNSGLLAPQFGLGRLASHTSGDTSHSAARDAPKPAETDVSGPVVTFKRRRHIEGLLPGSREGERAADSIKAPKVYQLTPSAPATPARQVDEPASAVQAAPPVVQKPRRRRDPVRQPTLVQHVVFEPAPVSAQPEAPPTPGNADKVDAKALRSALAELDDELQGAVRCRDAFRDLDKLLTSLGIPRAGSPARR